MSRLAPVLILGLDGATFDVIEPLVAAGRLPNLAAWQREGVSGPLPSTVPPMSFPAWSSFLTGTGPGRHGIFDFTQKVPGAYRLRFQNASHRVGRGFPTRVGDAGGRALALGIPATFPAPSGAGLTVPGFDAPVSAGTDARSTSDPSLYEEVAAVAGPWMRPDLDEAARGVHWHERARTTLLERIDRKTNFTVAALDSLRARDGARPDLAAIVFSESDTVAHHFWRDHDPSSPRRDAGAGSDRRGAVSEIYERLDAACGEIRAAFGDDALCVVMSDHGSGGASRRIVHLNRRLAECGLLQRASGSFGRSADRAARAARDLALRALPPALAQRIFRRARRAAARVESTARFGGLDWTRTAAFSEEANTQPGVWINLRGREARGCVDPADYERVRGETIAALLDWKLPGGGTVVARARRREDVYDGPLVDRAPDIVVELGLDDGYSLSLVATPWEEATTDAIRTLEDDELGGGRGRGMNGGHRPDGIFLAVGGDVRPAVPASIEGVAPAVLRAMGIEAVATATGDAESGAMDYTPEEEARVAARLRALGYLE